MKRQALNVKQVGEAMMRLNDPDSPFRKGRARVSQWSHKAQRTSEDDHIELALLDALDLFSKRLRFGVPVGTTSRRKEMTTIRNIAERLNHVISVEEVKKYSKPIAPRGAGF